MTRLRRALSGMTVSVSYPVAAPTLALVPGS